MNKVAEGMALVVTPPFVAGLVSAWGRLFCGGFGPGIGVALFR